MKQPTEIHIDVAIQLGLILTLLQQLMSHPELHAMLKFIKSYNHETCASNTY